MKPQKPKPQTTKSKSLKITAGLALLILSFLVGGAIGILLLIIGLSMAGNALFAPTVHNDAGNSK